MEKLRSRYSIEIRGGTRFIVIRYNQKRPVLEKNRNLDVMKKQARQKHRCLEQEGRQ